MQNNCIKVSIDLSILISNILKSEECKNTIFIRVPSIKRSLKFHKYDKISDRLHDEKNS